MEKNSSPDIVSPWIENNATSRIGCSCNRNYNHNHNEGSDVSDTSIPQISRTPSSICPASPTYQDTVPDNPDRLDDVDGLPLIHCDVQMRVQQIIVEHKVLISMSIIVRKRCLELEDYDVISLLFLFFLFFFLLFFS